MILKDNICTQIGDTIFFETTPIWGMMRQFSSLSEDIIGQNSNRYFEKDFRYSYDGGIIYSSWKTLDESELSNVFQDWLNQNQNLLSAGLDEKSDLKIQFKYKRVGTDDSGELILNGITLNGYFLYREFDFKTIDNSIFSDIIHNNIDLFNLTMNLTNKMYEVGVVPNYIERKQEDENNLLQDRDYIDLWKAVAEFYSMIFLYALRFTNIYWQKDLLCEYLAQKGIFLCNCDDIIEMQKISQNFYDEIRVRGTSEIFKPKRFKNLVGQIKKYYGPNGWIMSQNNPLEIDGVKYYYTHELPYGWILYNAQLGGGPAVLLTPDMNYHKIRFNSINQNNEIISQESTDIQNSEGNGDILKEYNGEYLRLICYSANCDEFMYSQVNIKDFGWNVYNASPMYKGLDDRYGSVVKAYEPTKDFILFHLYPWFGLYNPTETDILQTPYCTPSSGVIGYTTDQLCIGVMIINSEIII